MSFLSRLKFKLTKRKLRFKRRLNPPHVFTYKEEKVIYIIRTLIRDETSIMTIAPISEKKYIRNDKRGMFVIIDDVDITLSSNIGMYYYNLKVNDAVSKILTKNFNNVLESRRNRMEKETVAGVTSNLDFISKHMNDYEKTINTD